MVFTCSYANIGIVKMYVCVCNTLHGYDLAGSRVIITWIPRNCIVIILLNGWEDFCNHKCRRES